jgi:hypothetical protein
LLTMQILAAARSCTMQDLRLKCIVRVSFLSWLVVESTNF